MAKSSYAYAKAASRRPKSKEYLAATEAIAASFRKSCGRYGYRRILQEINSGDAALGIGEFRVRTIMRKMGLYVRTPRRPKRFNSYIGGEYERAKSTKTESCKPLKAI
ncbi:IS3 family transposase [uncultured Olegusella sp.]|uniref:IS3 family transposase n=1 Tax=uncultured Olegusella sp. TaxID=1979846 RepID=UPI00345D8AEF